MDNLLKFPRRPFPATSPAATPAPTPAYKTDEFYRQVEVLAKNYEHSADRIDFFFKQSQTGPLRARPAALGATFAELASIPNSEGQYAAMLLLAIAFPSSQTGLG